MDRNLPWMANSNEPPGFRGVFVVATLRNKALAVETFQLRQPFLNVTDFIRIADAVLGQVMTDSNPTFDGRTPCRGARTLMYWHRRGRDHATVA